MGSKIEVPAGVSPALSLDTYQAGALRTARFDPRMGIIYPALGVAGEAGELAEKVKKWLRDDKPASVSELPSGDRAEAIKKELGDVLWYASVFAAMMGWSLSDVALTNLEKLYDRADRGVIHGEGDNR